MTLDEATEQLLGVYATARKCDPGNRYVLRGGLEVEEHSDIRIVNYSFVVTEADGVYTVLTQGHGQLNGPTCQGSLDEIIAWLLTTGAVHLRSVRAHVEVLRARLAQ